ncbi:hypothetical protein LL033_12155 [Clostridium estertheticum]|uniref:hypothetical protein n=1 Tax=Clostridium estertheticum TaxID=238834 RepID=UPI001C0BE40A|nr:hypothetical protein [Clostridium estertheticum]MBU3213545.1 hypothetical protein [Clostridium estertheticum]WAG57856.1 hypothetical protein LL033_12155 [Clostridium estertheticum]
MELAPVYTIAISLIGCILLSIFSKKLKSKTVNIIEYTLIVITMIGVILLFFTQ